MTTNRRSASVAPYHTVVGNDRVSTKRGRGDPIDRADSNAEESVAPYQVKRASSVSIIATVVEVQCANIKLVLVEPVAPELVNTPLASADVDMSGSENVVRQEVDSWEEADDEAVDGSKEMLDGRAEMLEGLRNQACYSDPDDD